MSQKFHKRSLMFTVFTLNMRVPSAEKHPTCAHAVASPSRLQVDAPYKNNSKLKKISSASTGVSLHNCHVTRNEDKVIIKSIKMRARGHHTGRHNDSS